jgi:hypothetical protein
MHGHLQLDIATDEEEPHQRRTTFAFEHIIKVYNVIPTLGFMRLNNKL